MDIKAAEGRFEGVQRPYTEQDVQRLRGSVKVEQTLAQRGADKLWELLKNEPYVHALGALSGNQVRWVGGRVCRRGGCFVPAAGPTRAPIRPTLAHLPRLSLRPSSPCAGCADGQGGPEGHLPVGLAGGWVSGGQLG